MYRNFMVWVAARNAIRAGDPAVYERAFNSLAARLANGPAYQPNLRAVWNLHLPTPAKFQSEIATLSADATLSNQLEALFVEEYFAGTGPQ